MATRAEISVQLLDVVLRTAKGDPASVRPCAENAAGRLHGGKSTGPRTAAGIHGIRSAHWKDGSRSPRLQAECRADFARTHGSGVFFAGMITVRGICTGGPPDEWAAEPKNKAAAELGKRGGEARAKNMTKKERSEAARSGGAQ